VIKFPTPKAQRTVSSPSATTLNSLFDVVFAPLPDSTDAQICALLPTPETNDGALTFLQNFQPEGWNPFAELMWNFRTRDCEESETFTQPEVDRSISYLDEEFQA
jgi:hypothetical protein